MAEGKPGGATLNLEMTDNRAGQSFEEGGKFAAVSDCGGLCPVKFQYMAFP